MKNGKITEMLGIKYPIFQGGMAWIADAELAAAVSITSVSEMTAASILESLKAHHQIFENLFEFPLANNYMK